MHLDNAAPGAALELARCALSHQPAVIDDRHLGRQVVGLLEVLGGEQHVGAAGDQRADHVPELETTVRVESGGGLVQQQQAGPADQAGAEVEAAAHAAGIRAHHPVRSVAEPQPIDDGGGLMAGRRAGETEKPRHHLDVLAPGHGRLDSGVLPGEGDHPAHLGRVADRVDAVYPQAAAVRAEQRGHQVHERGLAGAVRTQQSEHLARAHRQAQPVQGLGLAEGLAEPIRLDRHGHG